MDNKIEVENLTKKEIVNVKRNTKHNIFSKILKVINLNAEDKKQNNQPESIKKNAEKFGLLKVLKNKQIKTIIIVLFFGLLALIILNSSFGDELTNLNSSDNNLGYMSSLDYCEKLENKLVEVLSGISGAGDVKVMVTVASGPELNVASSKDERTNTTTSGNNTTTNTTLVEDPIVITSSGTKSPLVLSEISPEIKGVVVVASGAKDVSVRLNLLQAVMALLDVSSTNIQIYY